MMTTPIHPLKPFLDQKAALYNSPEFITTDPIQIPHIFTQKQDIEISAFLTAIISWGQRKTIINNAKRLMDLMDNDPFDFLCNFQKADQVRFERFVHRTFNGGDCLFFLRSLRNIYLNHGGLEAVFREGYAEEGTVYGTLNYFRRIFLSIPYEKHVCKHIADVSANASAKRLNMFLRWMVRSDEHEVDFGLWKDIPASALMLPLDVHTGDVARAYGLLTRKQNDWKAVEEVTAVLRTLDANDPVKYDFALFGIGAFEGKGDLI